MKQISVQVCRCAVELFQRRSHAILARQSLPLSFNYKISQPYRIDQQVRTVYTNELQPPKDNVSIVFTDIVNSTLIWEKDEKVMAAAMVTHDDVVRKLTDLHHGYEVKQNGDGFMIAFANPISALQFCLDAQQQLLNQDWPKELLELSPGEEAVDKDGKLLFRGLRLRMSAHWGTPVCRWNNVIKRMDYLGPMVNRAARFVEVTEGGQIVVSEKFLEEVRKAKRLQSDEDLSLKDIQCNEGSESKDQEFEVRLLGEHPFKGLSKPETLYFIIPRTLHGRLDSWPKHKYVQGSKGNIIPSSG